MTESSAGPWPQITLLQYAPGLIRAVLDSAPAPPLTGGVFEGNPTGTNWLASDESSGSEVSLRIDESKLQPTKRYTVALTFDAANPSWFSMQTLVFQKPALEAIRAVRGRSETLIDVEWTLPKTSSITEVLAGISDTTSHAVVTSENYSGSGGRLRPVGLDPSGTYNVVINGAHGVALGPFVASPDLIVSAPGIASIVYAASSPEGTSTVTVTPDTAENPPGTVVGRLLQDGTVVSEEPADGATVTFTRSQPLDPRSAWQVEIFYTKGIVSGPCGRAGIDIPELPEIDSLFYAGDVVNVVLVSAPVPGATVAVFKGAPSGTGWVARTFTTMAATNIDVSGLDPTFQYMVAATIDAAASPVVWGTATVLVFQQPNLVSIVVTPEAVDVEWSLPSPTSISNVRASVYDAGNQATVTTGEFQGSSGRLDLSAPLAPDGDYWVAVGGVNGVASSGPVQSDKLLTMSPTVKSLVYAMVDDDTYTVTVTPEPQSGVPGYVVAQLLSDGRVVAEGGSGESAPVLQFTAPLDPASSWQVVLRNREGIQTGPAGNPVLVPTEGAQLVSARYDGSAFSIEWNVPFGGPGATGGRVSIREGTTEVGSADVADGFAARITGITVDPEKSYAVAVAPILGSGLGLYGAPVPLIVASPQVTAVDVEADQATVTISGVAPQGNTSALLLFSGAEVLRKAPGGRTGGFFPLPAESLPNLAVAAQAVADGVVGPPSSKAPTLTTAVASFSDVVYSGADVVGKVAIPGGVLLESPAVSVSLYADGIAAGAPVTANAQGAFSVPAGAPTAAGLSLRARISGTSEGATVTGPPSEPVPVLAAAPQLADVSLMALAGGTWRLRAKWSVTGNPVGTFDALLSQDGVGLKTWSVAGIELDEDAPAFEAGKPLTLTVTPKGRYGTGPVSAPATFLPVAPESVATECDGSTVTATWSAVSAGDPAVTASAYRLRLVESTAAGWVTLATAAALDGTTAMVSVPPAAVGVDADFGVMIDLAVGGTRTQPEVVTPVVLQTPVISSAVNAYAPATANSIRSFAIEWTAPARPSTGITGYVPVVKWGRNETALPTLPATPTAATVTIPASVPNGAVLGLRAVAGTATGPAGAATPLLMDQPTGVQLSYDGDTIRALWNPIADGRVGGYQVTLTPSDSPPTTHDVTEPAFEIAFPRPTEAGDTVSITVAATAAGSTGPVTSALDVILYAPEISKAQNDADLLSLAWSAVDGAAVTGYSVDVLSGGAVSQTIAAGGTSAAIAVPPGPYTIQVRATGAFTTGPPPSTAFQPLLTAPTVTGAGFDAVSAALKLEWDGATAAAYRVELSGAGAPSIVHTTTTNSISLSGADLPPAGIYSARVRTAASEANDDITGPWSAAVPAVVSAPQQVTIRYDGRRARINWTPMDADTVTGYRVTVLDGATPDTTVAASGPPVTIDLPFDSSKSLVVAVQAVTAIGAGLPSEPAPVFRPGWYGSTDRAKTPYVIPAQLPTMPPEDIVVYLPDIFSTPVSTGLPTTPPFVLATTTPPFAYTLTMPKDSVVWTFTAEPIRPDVTAAYDTLLTALVALHVTPMGWRIVQDAIARSMPQTFDEILRYGCGFVPAEGYVDLKPGMVLRAEYESYQYLGPGQTNPDLIDGYVSTATSEYEVASYVAPDGSWLTGFDAFLSDLTQVGTGVPAPTVNSAGSSGGGGGIDLYYAQFRQPFCRLVYPPTIMGAGASDPRPAFNVALLAAADYPTLNDATANIRNAQPVGSGVAVTYLRGRTVLTACLRVWVDGVPMVVPVGTMVGNLLENMGTRPPVLQQAPVEDETPGTGLPLSGLTLIRSIGHAITDPAIGTSGYPVGAGRPIHLDWDKGAAYSATTDWLSLPVLPGDRLATGR